ncbi:MAG: type 4a pilus biogenesis protein PilO [Gemmatimonadota bacterium]|nr:type 4a pilus biogenesis protein PilO [Gemmatimonadota bacterium]
MNPKMIPIYAIIVSLALGYMAWSGDGLNLVGIEGIQSRRANVQSMQDSIVALRAQTDSVKSLVASGRVEELRARVESYSGSLALLRQFVPESNEVPDLIDAITTRGKIRGVSFAALTPLPVVEGPIPYETHSYQIAVIGRYDQVGEFLSDIASLRRIIVPENLILASAPAGAGAVLGDTSRAVLEARFMIRTYVKAASSAGVTGGN